MSKKIIILNYGLHVSGVSRTLVNFANALVNHGYDVTIKIEVNDFTLEPELDSRVKISLFLKEPHPFGFRIKGFLRYYFMWISRVFLLAPKSQYKKIVKDKYDIEIAFNRGAAARIIAASTNPTSQKLVWVHSDYMRNDNPLAGFDTLSDAKDGYHMFDNIICVSEQAQKSFSQKFGGGTICVSDIILWILIEYKSIVMSLLLLTNAFSLLQSADCVKPKTTNFYWMRLDC